jgi:hypothetical protein
MKTVLRLLLVIGGLVAVKSHGVEPQKVAIAPLEFSPVIDGQLEEWLALEPERIRVTPAMENDKKNRSGTLEVEFWAGMREDRIHIAARWPDGAPDTEYRPWQWRTRKYKRSKIRDDMFALRFAMAGEFNRSMLAAADYEVDVWVWSAGRSDRVGLAEDYRHRISLQMIENVAEYETDSGETVYIERKRDSGERGYCTIKPGKTRTADRLPSIEVRGQASGSVADVSARGLWKDGYWHLEMQRLLDTGHADDVSLYPGLEILGQLAVFNKIGSKHKSVSEPLLFRFDG